MPWQIICQNTSNDVDRHYARDVRPSDDGRYGSEKTNAGVERISFDFVAWTQMISTKKHLQVFNIEKKEFVLLR